LRQQIFDSKGDRLVHVGERFVDRLALAVAAGEGGYHGYVPTFGVRLEEHVVLQRGHARSLSRAASFRQAFRPEIGGLLLTTRLPTRSELRRKLGNNLPPLSLRREPQRCRQRGRDHADQGLRRQPPAAARIVQRFVRRSRPATLRNDA